MIFNIFNAICRNLKLEVVTNAKAKMWWEWAQKSECIKMVGNEKETFQDSQVAFSFWELELPTTRFGKKKLSKSNNICFIEKVLKTTNIMGLHSPKKNIVGKSCLF